jgi:hypothetical protein
VAPVHESFRRRLHITRRFEAAPVGCKKKRTGLKPPLHQLHFETLGVSSEVFTKIYSKEHVNILRSYLSCDQFVKSFTGDVF